MPYSIIVHGGAGPLLSGESNEDQALGCLDAARAGHRVLAEGGSALDAVVAAVKVLEDDPRYNAGTGASLNLEGDVETDASLMTGEGLAGAVAALRDVKNPITVARLVMEKTAHVMLVGEGARRFAVDQGVPLLPKGALITERQRIRWAEALEALKASAQAGSKYGGTVGAAAVDSHGRVAAGTSTGGTNLKIPGRVGDAPLIGCGTFALEGLGAASCTGIGEAIIKTTLASQLVRALAGGTPIAPLATELVEQLKRHQGDGGIIAVGADGRVGYGFNTPRMSRAWIDAAGHAGVGFGREDTLVAR